MGTDDITGVGVAANGCTVAVRVVPRSPRPGIERSERGLVVRVKAAPEAGKATDEARRRLAEALGVPASRVRLRTGATSRRKVFEVAGVPAERARERLGGSLADP